ncbi:MAG: glycosyl transferase family 2 [Planctomycetota bacterium]|nr:MAG: glycosyl transferase family 2 [Planctomycetota bacterium]REJ90761.1 MAG: glycosyl transferase family 2 [Planctomycetota bacterium]REK22770.1 MAG: glycosyl transferase family 2 [Planctomycetota bacterium]REK33810.1 MAG: glycosyl transferase family 2 [Planctomycetota bacterium]
MSAPAAVILAAGQGKRMKSDLPKVLHIACGRPLVAYVIDAARAAGAGKIVLVVGHKQELVREAMADQQGIAFAVQEQQLGTGDAVKASRDALADHDGAVLVLAGDMPLVTSRSLGRLLELQQREKAACVVGTARTEQNKGLGRIVRDSDGVFQRIVEEADASPQEKAITEINTGCYAFETSDLFAALDEIKPENDQTEYYLTDCAEILLRRGKRVLAECCFDVQEAIGVNTREQLAEVERILGS